MLSELRAARRAGELAGLTRPGEFEAVLEALAATDWVVYAKPCLGHTEQVVDYLARYSNRIALCDARLHEGEGGRIGLDYRDYADGGSHKRLWLQPEELIRHYGFLANCCREERLGAIRAALVTPPPRSLPRHPSRPVTPSCAALNAASGACG